jgi:hypothetical protein
MTPDDLERAVHRSLRGLPPPKAPHSLLPGVMQAVRRRTRRPWYAQPWSAWTPSWQTAAALLLVTAVMGVLTLLSPSEPLIPASANTSLPGSQLFETVDRGVEVVAIVSRVVSRTMPGMLLLFVLGAASSLTLVLGAALGRLALGGASHS